MSSQNKIIIRRCRELRRKMTPAEAVVWDFVRNRKFQNLKFLRQHPFIHNLINGQLYYFIADFYCDEKEIIVEIDGPVHDQSKEYDQMRDIILKEYGLTTVRIKNEDAVNPDKLREILNNAIKMKR